MIDALLGAIGSVDAVHDASGRQRPQMPRSLARRPRGVLRIIAGARAEARGRQIMTTQTTQEPIRPVTGTHVVRVPQPGGRLQMLCNDPDGNTLEFQPATV
jgi:hypothetical protein